MPALNTTSRVALSLNLSPNLTWWDLKCQIIIRKGKPVNFHPCCPAILHKDLVNMDGDDDIGDVVTEDENYGDYDDH